MGGEMKDYLSRAMQISTMELDQIEKLHEIENLRGYLIPNCNIQDLFNLPTIKDRYNIPDDDLAQAGHNKRIDAEINRLELRKTDPAADSLDYWHKFDFNVHNLKHSMIWDYAGGGRKNVKDLINSGAIIVLVAFLAA
jgi:hypothetical protein